MRAYEMPAAFQANAILTEIVDVGLRGLIVSWYNERVKRISSSELEAAPTNGAKAGLGITLMHPLCSFVSTSGEHYYRC